MQRFFYLLRWTFVPRSRKWRISFGVFALLILFALGPYIVSRVLSSAHALSVETIALHQLSAAPVEGSDAEFRIVCYNIAHGRGLATSNWEGGTAAQRKARLDDIAELLVQLDADVVVLNEVDFDSSWSQSVDQAVYLAERAGYRYCATLRNLDFCIGFWSWRFGNAVLSRYPIAETHEIDLPGYARWETTLAGKKRALFCEIEIGDERVGIVAAHLSHRSEDLRSTSAKRLLAFAESYDRPLIIAGDLNSTPTGFPYMRTGPAGLNAIDVFDQSKQFVRIPVDAPADAKAYTFRSDRPDRVIDWILVPKSLSVPDYWVEPSTLSDHRPVVADLMLPEVSAVD